MPYPNDTSSVLQGLLQSYRPSAAPYRKIGLGGQVIDTPSRAEMATPYEQEWRGLAEEADERDRSAVEAIRKSQALGFENPQQQMESQRKFEMQKFQLPLEQERERQRGALALAQEKGQQASALQEAKSQGQLEAISKFIGAGGMAPGGHMSISGVGSVTAPKQQPAVQATTLNQLSQARKDYETSRTGLFGRKATGDPGKKQRLDQLIAGAVANHPSTPEDKAFAYELATDQDTAGIPVNQLADKIDASGDPTFNQDRLRQILELVSIYRGF